MCQNYIELKNGKIERIKGEFKKGEWAICLDCGIIKLQKKRYPKLVNLMEEDAIIEGIIHKRFKGKIK